MKAIERRLADLEQELPAFTIPQADAPADGMGVLEWLYLVTTLPDDDPHRAKLREVQWSDGEFQRAITDKRAMRAFMEALPKASRDRLREGLRMKAAEHAAAALK